MVTALVLTLRDEHDIQYPPAYWLKRAEETRELARQLKDLEARHEMETVARLYERLAKFAERRLSGRKAD